MRNHHAIEDVNAMTSDPTNNQFGSNQFGNPKSFPPKPNPPRPLAPNPLHSQTPAPVNPLKPAGAPQSNAPVPNPLKPNPLRPNPLQANPLRPNPLQTSPMQSNPLQPNPLAKTQTAEAPVSGEGTSATATAERPAAKPPTEASTKLATDLKKFEEVASGIRNNLNVAGPFEERCQQAFDVANDLFGNAPTWVCFYRELLGGSGLVHTIFDNNADLGRFLRTEQYHQIQMMLTALRSRDLPESDPNDPQRMITVRLPKSLHEAMCDEAGRLNISVNRLCISRMLQLLDPQMIPETNSKPRGRKPRTRQKKAD